MRTGRDGSHRAERIHKPSGKRNHQVHNPRINLRELRIVANFPRGKKAFQKRATFCVNGAFRRSENESAIAQQRRLKAAGAGFYLTESLERRRFLFVATNDQRVRTRTRRRREVNSTCGYRFVNSQTTALG